MEILLHRKKSCTQGVVATRGYIRVATLEWATSPWEGRPYGARIFCEGGRASEAE